MIQRLLPVLVALVALALTASPALAHAELIQSDPADGGTLTSTPYTMTLAYDEPLDGEASSVVVRDSAGAEVASGGLRDDDDTVMTVELPALPAGEYTVRWTAVTPDDNGVERGTLTFTVAATAATAATEAPTVAPTSAPSLAPSPTAEPAEPTTPTGSNDLQIALLVAGVVVIGLLSYLYMRNRR